MKYLVVGGEFVNKGAEAMLITVCREIKNRDSFASITALISYGEIDYDICNTLKIRAHYFPGNYVTKLLYHDIQLRDRIRDIAAIFWKKKYHSIRKIKGLFTNADYLIDISGYALTSKWSVIMNDFYLNKIVLMNRLNSRGKIVLMPQSFGPFDYANSNYVEERLVPILRMCELIYAREEGGYKLLKSLGLKNVKKGYDLVLTANSICSDEAQLVFKKRPINILLDSIGLIPNVRLFDKTNMNNSTILGIYTQLINLILKKQQNVYLLPHSGEDITICELLKKHYEKNDAVICVNSVIHSYEFQNVVSSFKFVIASRFHSIVHSYKEGIPAIIIGWSEKYDELASLFDQSKYILSPNADETTVASTLDKMEENYIAEQELIRSILPSLQMHNCYSFLGGKNDTFNNQEDHSKN